MKKIIISLSVVISLNIFANDEVYKWAENYQSNLTEKTLYGEVFRNNITKDGRLACARVVQIILKQSGFKSFQEDTYLVSTIQKRTKNWKKLSIDQVQKGDLIFWRRILTNSVCDGGGDCHVGISVGDGYSLDNKGAKKRPTISKIKRFGWKFLYAKRTPELL